MVYMTHNLNVVGSNPVVGIFFSLLYSLVSRSSQFDCDQQMKLTNGMVLHVVLDENVYDINNLQIK